MIRLFSRYVSIGMVNTFLHWVIFSILVFWLKYEQSISNTVAFIITVTFSFFANARYTFKAKATGGKYFLFVSFMGGLSFLSGKVSDHYLINPIITLIEFSAISLVFGFLYSHYVVFKKIK